MQDFNANSHIYNLTADKALADILSHFNSEFIFDVINSSIEYSKGESSLVNGSGPNAIEAFEQNFKSIANDYPSDISNIELIRIDTYKEIVNLLGAKFNLAINEEVIVDYYSAAYYLYDFLVRNFVTYMVSFFSEYIRKEKAELYVRLNLEAYKNNKDSSTIYGKKIYKDPILAIINANLEKVIYEILSFDFTFNDILTTVYKQSNINISNYLASIACPINHFFKDNYAKAFEDQYFRCILLTSIRLDIQRNIDINTGINITLSEEDNV